MDYKRVLRLHYVNGFSGRSIAKQTGDGRTTVNEFLKRFEVCEELSWPLSEEVTNERIENLLYTFSRYQVPIAIVCEITGIRKPVPITASLLRSACKYHIIV